jgi:hypothetical protein
MGANVTGRLGEAGYVWVMEVCRIIGWSWSMRSCMASVKEGKQRRSALALWTVASALAFSSRGEVVER